MKNIQRITYTNEEITRRRNLCYKTIFNFHDKTYKGIKNVTPVSYMGYLRQQRIYWNEKTGPDIGFSDYQIIRSKYHLQIHVINIVHSIRWLQVMNKTYMKKSMLMNICSIKLNLL